MSPGSRDPDGIAIVDKPSGMTSHDVVDRARKIFGTRKVGHAGTLDPDATGVLVLGVGRATRLMSYAQASTKSYRAVGVLGVTTTTQDASGEVIESGPVEVARSDLESAVSEFVGDIDQVPPMVSAIKVGGERLYRKARRGEEVERPPRPVTIHSLQLIDYVPGSPEFSLDVVCSSGTYVRTLVHDIGRAVGCGAHLTSLRRTAVGAFTEVDAVPLDDLAPEHLRPALDALGALPRVDLDEAAALLVRDGRPIPLPDQALPAEATARGGGLLALVREGRLVAVYRREGDQLVAEKVLAS